MAKSLEAQELSGVTIKTAKSARYVELNQQDIRLFDKNEVRGYWGFYNRSSDNALQPTFILGRNAAANINGSLVMKQITPIVNGIEQFDKTEAYIGMAAYYDATTNVFGRNSQIIFYRDGGHLNILADGRLYLSSKNIMSFRTTGDSGFGDIQFYSNKYFAVESNNAVLLKSLNSNFEAEASTNHTFKNGTGNFYFENKTKTGSGNQMLLSDDNNNADLRLAYIRIRGSHVSGYQSSLQLIPTGESAPTAGLQLGNLSYTSLTNRSSRAIKSNIRDLEINSLDKIMGLKVQQYNFKSDVERLYQMRENAVGTGQLFTTNDIPLQYGLILEDTERTFVADAGDGINLYTLVTLNVDATQQIKITQDVHEEEISILKSKVATQEDRIARLEELVQKLINEKPEQQ